VRDSYLEAIQLTERLHRQFLELVKTELERLAVSDVNNVQSLILFNIGPDELSIGELMYRGYYLGSNVSYNVRKLVENGYLVQQRSVHDRRTVHVRLSPKGLALCQQIDTMIDRQVEALAKSDAAAGLAPAADGYRRLERFWRSLIAERSR